MFRRDDLIIPPDFSFSFFNTAGVILYKNSNPDGFSTFNRITENTKKLVPIPDSHASCVVCGKNGSLGLQFSSQGDSVVAVFQANNRWQGYAGVLHGGMISTLLDAAMTHCLFNKGIEAMTASLKVRFLEPVPSCGELELRASLGEKRRHVYLLKAELLSSGRCMAKAEARFIEERKA